MPCRLIANKLFNREFRITSVATIRYVGLSDKGGASSPSRDEKMAPLLEALPAVGDDVREQSGSIYPEDCMLCLYCERDCPVRAIYVSPEKTARPMVAWD